MIKCAFLCILMSFLSGCISYPSAKFPRLTIVLFNGHGEDVEVICKGEKLVRLEGVHTDDNNVAAIREIERTPGKFELLVKRNGKLAGHFLIDSERIGTVYLFLSQDGSVILEDGEKLPPLV